MTYIAQKGGQRRYRTPEKEHEEKMKTLDFHLGNKASVRLGQGRGKGRTLLDWMMSSVCTSTDQDIQEACKLDTDQNHPGLQSIGRSV